DAIAGHRVERGDLFRAGARLGGGACRLRPPPGGRSPATRWLPALWRGFAVTRRAVTRRGGLGGVDGRIGRHGALADHVVPVLARFEAFEGCLAQQVVRGPLGELGANDQFRLSPVDPRKTQAGYVACRWIGPRQRVQLRAEGRTL